MTVREQFRWWSIGGIIFILFLWLLRDALVPFIAGAAIAYLADPIADRLQARGFSRVFATITLSIIALIIGVSALLLLIPALLEQGRAFAVNAPAYAVKIQTLIHSIVQRLEPTLMKEGSVLKNAFVGLEEQVKSWSIDILKSAWSSGLALIDALLILIVTPVVAFYLLLDWDHMVAKIDSWIPRQHAKDIRKIWSDIDSALAGFVRGQLSVCGILGSFYAIGLTLVGLDFGLLIGLFAGMVSFIPYVGSILGLIASVGIALVQFWPDPIMIGLVVAVFVVGQAIEGNYLTPKLVGGSIGLHPVWLMFALSAFGSLLGFTGLMVAVPVAAALGVLARFGISRYLQGRLYDPRIPADGLPPDDHTHDAERNE